MSIQSKVKGVFKLIFDSDYRFLFLANTGRLWFMDDEIFLKRKYKIITGEELNIDNPILYTEKMQWLKLYDRRIQYTTMVDKYEAKKLVADKIGEEFIIPTLGVWDNPDNINFEELPKSFVLKTTHDSGTAIICKNKEDFNINSAKKQLRKSLKRKYYDYNREWPYKNVKPRIIAEKYMEDIQDRELRDYKFFTFGGEPKVLYIARGRADGEETVADFFDMEFNNLNFRIDHNSGDKLPHPPSKFEEMKELARILSEGTPQLRVDFYEANGKVYFGEMTFFHCSGFCKFSPEEWNKKFGDWINLPEKRL